jgi:hypothetical protein
VAVAGAIQDNANDGAAIVADFAPDNGAVTVVAVTVETFVAGATPATIRVGVVRPYVGQLAGLVELFHLVFPFPVQVLVYCPELGAIYRLR